MGSLRPTGRFLPFTNNIQRTQKQPVPGSFPQSLSGSETDISTSNENLSNEERYVIRHTARVEPQGQENMQANLNRSSLKDPLPAGSNRSSLKDSIGGGPNSNRSSLDVSSSSYNTLIIHNADDTWTGRLSGIRDHASDIQNHASNQSSPYHTLMSQNDMKKPSGIPLPIGTSHKEHPTLPRNGPNYIDVGGQRIYTSPPEHGVQEITEIPDDYLNQSSVLKHLAKEVARSPSGGRSPAPATPPPSHSRRTRASPARSPSKSRSSRTSESCVSRTSDGQGSQASEGRSSAPKSPPTPKLPTKGSLGSRSKLSREKLSLSRSQPDLSSIGVRAVPGGSDTGNWSSEAGTDGEDDGTCFAEMLDCLAHENAQLKVQLDEAWQKISKTQKLEDEVSAVHRAHEDLVGSCERRERLERAARARLQGDCRRLHEINRALRDHVELLTGQMIRPSEPMGPSADALRKELQNREMLIAQLITQNKELSCSKERQEIEIAAQRATLQEQRTHIDILDTALTNAQANVVRLEEECRHAHGYIERVAQLQRALTSLQQASDRREQTERKLRSQLEKELQNLRSRDNVSGSPGPGGHAGSAGISTTELRRLLREREERALALEGECAKWEQRYLEEATLRQAAIDAASIPKDAKIAALERTSQESERLMAEARSDKIRHMDELHDAQKKCADMESRVKELESKVAERDAMIKVLQKHTQSAAAAYDSSASLRNNSSREELVGFGASSSAASFSSQDTVPLYHRHRHSPGLARLPPTARPKLPSYSSPASTDSSASNFDTTKRSLDDELAQLDSRLDRAGVTGVSGVGVGAVSASQRGLCCFPAFSGKGRVGTDPSGLLGALVGARSTHDSARREDILLLEKQGLTSQRQRAQDVAEARRSGSLPPAPSSLPRPPRPARPSPRLYGRLPETETRKRPDSLLPAPRQLGRYGRLDAKSTDSGDSPARRDSSHSSLAKGTSVRDSASTSVSENSASSLPLPSKLAVYAASRTRRANSLNKDTKTDSPVNKYRIHF